jgi:hypothetical protein
MLFVSAGMSASTLLSMSCASFAFACVGRQPMRQPLQLLQLQGTRLLAAQATRWIAAVDSVTYALMQALRWFRRSLPLSTSSH